jgi:ribosomal protein S27E
MHPDVAAALDRMHRAPRYGLPEEPNIRHFVRRDHDGRPLWASSKGFNAVASDEAFGAFMEARHRIAAKIEAEHCATVPVRCRGCGEAFYRPKYNRVNCDSCAAKALALRKGGPAAGQA